MPQLSLQQIMSIQKRCLLVGLGRGSFAAAKVLNSLGVSVVCIERRSRQQFLHESQQRMRLEELERLGVEIVFGVEGEAVAGLLDGIEYAAISPGVSLEGAVCGSLSRHGIKLIGQIELALSLWPGRVLLVTGANGKSTVAAMIYHILSQVGQDVLCVSNALKPFISEIVPYLAKASNPEKSLLVVEASGYELEACSLLHPDLGVFLNLTDRDVERFGSDSRVFMAEKQAFVRQTREQFAVINRDDRWGGHLLESIAAQLCSFGASLLPGVGDQSVAIAYDRQQGVDQLILRWNGKVIQITPPDSLIGLHNRYNLAAAILAACCLGINPDNLQTFIYNFTPLPYRLQMAGNFADVVWINDAKSTSAAASWAAVQAVFDLYADRKLTLLIGGEVRGCSWPPFFKFLAEKGSGVVEVLCFGKDSGLLANHCRAAGISCACFSGLQDALDKVKASLIPGQVVLLSPGCASFDQFSNYGERGQLFRSFLDQIAV